MTSGTFQIATTLDGKTRRDHPYIDSFEAHGFDWVVHQRLYGIGYTVSHKASGWAIPHVESVRPEEAKVKAMAYLDSKATQITKVIASVMK
jgi:hypothetical protein